MAMILYFHLTMYTEGTPLGVVRKVQNNDGFEAYRRLSYQYNPQTLGGQLSKLMKIVEFDFGHDDFLDRLAAFELMIEEYQAAGRDTVSDKLRNHRLPPPQQEGSSNPRNAYPNPIRIQVEGRGNHGQYGAGMEAKGSRS